MGDPLWESRAPSSPPRPLTWVASWPPRGPQDLHLLFPSVVPHSLRPQNLKLKCPFLLWGPATQLSSLSDLLTRGMLALEEGSCFKDGGPWESPLLGTVPETLGESRTPRAVAGRCGCPRAGPWPVPGGEL